MSVYPYMKPKVLVKLDSEKCKPYRAHETDAGADLVSTNSVIIYPGEQKMIDTGAAFKIPIGYVGLVFNRSSQGKVRVQIANGTGVIDAGYRNTVKVLLVNNGTEPYEITAYTTRIAQIVIIPVMLAEFTSWDPTMDKWEDASRGMGGFGSTGGAS